ncbi:Phthiocerol/phenolphthiocerol synthesis polyketide synthase type I PpsA [Actinomadura rubteroloni]|uniref:Phthiocerol/phenolphthiocerol synthesis polyketide synthase type I PpsA n=1 Tax=Actinomadura rubteroloni TaxID=1926885 RepID=A0A2P4UDI1_9ACTN|nr:SDR family oxidoreductase [Actinomadura rubteroloni]POM23108.1 Phthiocerol/phenolphthiocerol synthesis polyketide synthase type I PpsA [Actinomadura rubteroloni]
MSEFDGRTVLVTGGGHGIGKTISTRFALGGARVYINDSGESAEATAAELTGAGGGVEVLHGSVAEPDDLRRMMDHIRATAGTLDVLVNNAAPGALAPVREPTRRDWTRTWQTTVRGAVDCSLLASEIMRPGGAVVTMSSTGSGLVPGEHAALGIGNAALESATRYLAVELAPLGIRVNCACGVESPALRESPEAGEPRVDPGAYADLVLFLASERARWITGQTVLADGGLSIGAPLPTPPAPEPAQIEPVNAGEAIAIVGTGSVVPGADGTDALWKLLTSGDPVFREPGRRWSGESYHSPDRIYAPELGFVTTDAPESVRAEDHNTTWLRRAFAEAWDGVVSRPADRTALYIGASPDGSQHLEDSVVLAALRRGLAGTPDAEEVVRAAREHLRHAAPDPVRCLPHAAITAAAESVLPTPSDVMVVDTACSSSLYAIDLGMRRLRSGACDIAVCGGTLALAPRSMALFAALRGFSPTGAVRAFDSAADGTLFSDGAAVVVLKTLERARADGDPVLGVLTGLGTSCDGKGKAIYAPNSRGQVLAVRRAYRAGPSPEDVSWIVAHGTGTRAGDQTEFATLASVFPDDQDLVMTSNKSLIGHTGWPSGVLSVIHAVEGLRRSAIPAQRPAVTAPSPDLPPRVTVPDGQVPWPRPDTGVRTVAVNSFGFGGTNAHAVITDDHPGLAADPRPAGRDPVVLVGWNAVLPGGPSRQDVSAWLVSGAGETPAAFATVPPVPLRMLRTPPATHRTLDPSHRLALLAVDGLHDELGPFWSELKDTCGVIGAHCGLTSHAARHTVRCALDDLRDNVVDPRTAQHPSLAESFDRFAADARGAIEPATEDAFPGGMPSLIPARVAAALDLHGLAMNCDTGTCSSLDALRAACDHLASGDLDLALVVCVNAHSDAAWADLVLPAFDGVDELGETAVCFALTRRSHALRNDLPVLATLGDTTVVDTDGARPKPLERRSYMAADSAFAVLAHVLRREDATVSWTDPFTGRTARLAVAASPDTAPPAPPESEVVHRYALAYRSVQAVAADEAVETFPDHCLVLTNGSVPPATLPPHTLVVSTADGPERPGVHTAAPGEGVIAGLVAAAGWRPRHLRIVADSDADVLGLHELAFLALKECFDELGHGSVATLLYNAVAHGLPVGRAGLFTGFGKTVACDLPDATVLCVLSDADTPEGGLRHWGEELGRHSTTGIVLRVGADRFEPLPTPAPEPPATPSPPLDDTSVIVAAGGSRGITAALLDDLAHAARPKIWILGRSDITGAPAFPPGTSRSDHLRARRRDDPSVSIAAANREYDRQVERQETLDALRALTDQCGADRVRYLTCDVLDRAAVQRSVDRILAEDQVIDLLLFAAGVNRSTETRRKSLEEFRLVRDVKVRGHAHLRDALGSRHPRTWINMGSVSAFTGQPGNSDYTSANDYLATAAVQADAEGFDHRTIAWPIWKETGLASGAVMREQLARQGYTAITTAEGVRQFRHVLAGAPRPPCVLLLGPLDAAIADRRFPGIIAAADGQPPTHPLLSDAPSGEGDVRCSLDVERHSYLDDHLVDGRPTVPGAFLVEMAVEAASAACPGRLPVRVLDGTFERFLKAHPRTGTVDFRISTEIERSDDSETHVAVTFHSDLRSPKGRLPSRRHARCTVVLADSAPDAPRHPIVVPPDAVPLPDPYHLPNGSIVLRGAFVTTTATAVHDGTAYGGFAPPDHVHRPPFTAFRTPALLLDALARISVLLDGTETSLPVHALKSFREITFHRTGSDRDIADRARAVLLSAVREGPHGRSCVAADDAGEVLLTIRGLEGHPKGVADPRERRGENGGPNPGPDRS